ncbi:hypothetical protein Esti_005399 [Eimeria stiedai]
MRAVDLYVVKGDKSEEVLSDAGILLLPETVAFLGFVPAGAETTVKSLSFFGGKVGEREAVEFNYEEIERFRQHRPDMCQWAVDSDKGTELEFGLVFPTELSASSFHQQLMMRLCSMAFVEVFSSPCELHEYDRLAATWKEVEPQAEAQIKKKNNCSEAFLLAFKRPVETPTTTSSSSSSSSGGAFGGGGNGVVGRGKGGKGNTNSNNSNSNSNSSSSSSGRKNSTALETVAAAAGAAAAGAAAAAAGEREPAAAEAAEAAAAAATAAAAAAAAAVTVTLPLCYIRISQDEFIFPLPEQQELQWWGASTDGEKRLYRIKFTAAAAVEAATAADQQEQQQQAAAAAAVGRRFLDLYQLTLAEVTSKCRLSPHIDIDKQMGYVGQFETFAKDDEREGMQIDDADSDPSDDEEQFPVVARDPTKDLLRSSPNAMINELLEAGSKHSVVFRVGAGATGTSFLDRRDMQVLRFNEEGKHSVVAVVDGSRLVYNGRALEPTAAMLHDCEERLVVLDESDGSSAFLLDVETEKVLGRLRADGLEIRQVLPTTSTSKATGEATFLGLNGKSFFLMDTRMREGAARKQTYTYSQNQGFSCGATNEEGHIVLGSDKGVLRLYDGKTNAEQSFKRAKTQLAGFRDPVLHVAVTRDGAWILATCARYLLLYPVRLTTTEKTGFVNPLGSLKPKPFVLRLSLEDVSKYNLQSCCFKKAEFDEEETSIVTSTNNLVIIWDFVAVKNGKTDAYQVRRISDYIKDLAFISTKNKEAEAVVLVTPCSVTTRGVRRVYKDCESELEAWQQQSSAPAAAAAAAAAAIGLFLCYGGSTSELLLLSAETEEL